MSNVVVDDKGVPPVASLYHFKTVPVATKLATVAEPQKFWALALGSEFPFTVTPIDDLVLSQPFRVCET